MIGNYIVAGRFYPNPLVITQVYSIRAIVI